jgi:hypothetical protein
MMAYIFLDSPTVQNFLLTTRSKFQFGVRQTSSSTAFQTVLTCLSSHEVFLFIFVFIFRKPKRS